MTKRPPQIEMRLRGPAVEGRIPVDALVAIARELQTSLRRILSNRRQTGGRFRGEIEQTCQLDFIGFKTGSAVCTFEFAPPRDEQTLYGDQGVRAAEALLRVLEAGETGADGWSADAQPGLLDGLDKLTKTIGAGIDQMEMRLINGSHRLQAKVTSAFRAHLRAASLATSRVSDARIEGVVWECDWRNHTAELVEPDGNKINIAFPAELEDQVTEARKRRVSIQGQQRRVDGRVRHVNVTRIEILDDGVGATDPSYGRFADNLSIDELAARQDVPIPPSLSVLRSDWLDDEPLDEFLDGIERIRK